MSNWGFRPTGDPSEQLYGTCLRADDPRGWEGMYPPFFHHSLVNICFVVFLPEEIRILTRYNDPFAKGKSCMLSYVGISWRHDGLLIDMVTAAGAEIDIIDSDLVASMVFKGNGDLLFSTHVWSW